jgi:hypothetical protein
MASGLICPTTHRQIIFCLSHIWRNWLPRSLGHKFKVTLQAQSLHFSSPGLLPSTYAYQVLLMSQAERHIFIYLTLTYPQNEFMKEILFFHFIDGTTMVQKDVIFYMRLQCKWVKQTGFLCPWTLPFWVTSSIGLHLRHNVYWLYLSLLSLLSFKCLSNPLSITTGHLPFWILDYYNSILTGLSIIQLYFFILISTLSWDDPQIYNSSYYNSSMLKISYLSLNPQGIISCCVTWTYKALLDSAAASPLNI